jgi:hypothetical protein
MGPDADARAERAACNRDGPRRAARPRAVESRRPTENVAALYNGRSEIVNSLMKNLIEEIKSGRDVRFPVTTPSGMCRFTYFALRIGAEITRQVGEPFFFHVLLPSQPYIRVKVEREMPSDDAIFATTLTERGLT